MDRLVALANMPKPRVAIAPSPMLNAFATGRNTKTSVLVVTTGLLESNLDDRELEAVLAHELSHVAHKDVAVMTIASFLGIIAGLLVRFAFYCELFGGGGRGRGGNNNNGGAIPIVLIVMVVGIVMYAVSFLLIRLLSRYRELAADRAGALLTGQPSALASALQKVSGSMNGIPNKDLRSRRAAERVLLRPRVQGGRQGRQPERPVLHPPVAGAPAAPAVGDLRAAEQVAVGFLDTILGRTKPAQPTWTSCSPCPPRPSRSRQA